MDEKRYFAPSKLIESYKLDKLSGAYIPYWTFDSQTDSSFVVQIGTYYYVTETRTVYEDGKPKQVTEQVQKIRWHTEHGRYSEFFDDVLVKASQNVASGLIHKIEPFQLSGLLDYKMEYLSGFLAEKYSIPLKKVGMMQKASSTMALRAESEDKCTGMLSTLSVFLQTTTILRTSIFYYLYGFHRSNTTTPSIAF